jgi:GrpB protein
VLTPATAALADEHRQRIAASVPNASIVVTGSASVEGLHANDLDLVVLVSDVRDAAARLRKTYPPLYEDEWRDDWAAFRDPGPPQVDLVVTRPGTKGDAHHRRAWELLASDPGLLGEYRRLKASSEDYEQRKAAFFERVVSLLGEP